ncbi:hypothetical protein ACFQY8_04745 [Alloscardovia venturai]|uniref:Uncharacterized protein n=1 Tax=Alloscardovia venturai TaxID=1769421 RepID=A0ABW2Y734_9BIFI
MAESYVEKVTDEMHRDAARFIATEDKSIEVPAKKVSLTELFYDLVFVFAVSKITEIFEPLRHHEASWLTVLLYLTVFISFVGS